jgi:Ca2+-binding EF-hand superfamily protein
MRFIATAFTFGLCSITARGHAEPKAPSTPPNHAKSAPSLKDSSDRLYQELVAAADRDGDGTVSATELRALVMKYVEKQVAKRFERLDRDGDGRVTHSEVPNMVAARFERFDANGDGSFTRTELSAELTEQATERCRAVFARLDVDENETLSVADATAARPTRVAKR